MESHVVRTRDIYESAYLLYQGANIILVEPFIENKKLMCAFTFTGEKLLQSQNDYYNAKAEVNLWEFRRSFNRINSLIGTARKEFREQLETVRSKEAR